MDTQPKKVSNKTVQDYQKDADELAEEANAVASEIVNIKKDFDDSSAPLLDKINKDTEDAESMMSELDKVEKESGDEFDRLILEGAEDAEEGDGVEGEE